MSQNDSKAKPAILFQNKLLLTLFYYSNHAIRTNYLFSMKVEVPVLRADECACLNSVSFDSVLRKKPKQNEAIIFTFSTLVQANKKEMNEINLFY